MCLLGCAPAAHRAAVADATAALATAAIHANEQATHHAQDHAVQSAQARLHGAIPNPSDNALLRAAFIAAARGDDAAAAARIQAVWRTPNTDTKTRLAAIHLALITNHFDSARSLAWDALESDPALRTTFMPLWLQAHVQDPRFAPTPPHTLQPTPPHTLHSEDTIARIEHLGGGSSITMRFLDPHGNAVAAFKPNQTRQQSSYRGELAAYRLCPLINCGFEVPRNREVRISRDTLMRLAGRESDREIAAFDRQYRDVVWTVDPDGETWLYGTQKDWVPAFRTFAIEHRSAWRHLVQVGRTLRGTAESTLRANLTQYRRSSASPDTDGLTFDALARQLSNLHVYDYLTNNWDRYSRHYSGVNCQWRGDHFLSIDNGAAFGPRDQHGVAARRVVTNLNQVERFSRRTVHAIRWMQPDQLYPFLFPASELHDEKALFDDFVERRRRLLAYVDDQILEHGKAAVMCFD